jgi:exodeoxyribonuclease-5
LSEPQLPIYASLVAEDAVEAVVFAKVLLDKPGFSGIAAETGLLPGVLALSDEKQKIFAAQRFPDWPSVIEHWRCALRHVALEVQAGVASVTFAEAAALNYCDVKPLLRLAEVARQQAAWQAEEAS